MARKLEPVVMGSVLLLVTLDSCYFRTRGHRVFEDLYYGTLFAGGAVSPEKKQVFRKPRRKDRER